MKTTTTRRSTIAALGTGIAGLAVGSRLPGQTAFAAISSGAGVVAGGSLDGPNGPVQFSAFGSRLQHDDGSQPTVHASFSLYDPVGADGEPLTLALLSIGNYGPGDLENARVISGTLTLNGEGDHPFALWLVDNGEIGATPDQLTLSVGAAASEAMGTPVVATAVATFDYAIEGELSSGNIQLIDFV